MQMWELVAREHIRDTLARYNWSGDAGRIDDLADTFCADGVLEIRGFEPLNGRSAIVAFLGGITGKVADGADGRYRDTVVPDGDTWRIKHRKVSTDWAARNSTMARDI